jgi:type I restriction enzyme, S subunit
MGGEWTECTVDDLKSSAPNALATGPFGSAIGSRFFADSGVPVIRGSNLSQEVGIRLIDEGLVFIDKEKAREFSRSMAQRGDLIFTCWGTIDQVGLVDGRSRFPKYVVSNKQMKFTPDPKKADSLFLYYLFSSPLMREAILAQGIGSSVPGFNLGQLRSISLKIPPLSEQHAIAGILGALDDKIDVNRRMNESSEAMARALFKSWFIDFDPVRAKVDGRDPGLPEPFADLFPDSFDDSELGEIPADWKVGSIGDIAEVSNGKRPAIRYPEASGDASVPLWGGNGPMAFVPEPLIDYPILLTGRVGTLGSVFRITSPCWPSDNTLILYSNNGQTLEYLFFQLKRIDFTSLNRGSTQPLLTQTDLKAQRILVPTPELLERFHVVAASLNRRIDGAESEARTLAALRNTLLPKLISGQLRVRNAQRSVDEGPGRARSE